MADSTALSCVTCPSYLGVTEASAFFGKSTNAPMCAVYGYLLGRQGASEKQNKATAETYANGCPSHGKLAPTVATSTPKTVVFLPNPSTRVELGHLDPKRTVVRSCGQCKNFVPDDVVFKETGWMAGACQPQGKLIMGNRRVIEARTCQYKQVGTASDELEMPMLPAYTSTDDADKARIAAAGTYIEPTEYPSDREVAEEERESGILAWRKIDDPEGTGNSVMLPIFDPKSFTDQEQLLIPKSGSDEHPELYFDHNGAVYRIGVLWMELDETPAAWGQPGVGKTEVARHMAWLMSAPFYRFSIKESTELYELEGTQKFTPEDGTTFQHGRFPAAWSGRGVMVVDEPNMGRPEVWAFLRPCMDNSKQLVLDSNQGEIISRNDFCFLMLAMNPAWSPLNVGAAPIGAADASRLMHIEFGVPEEQVERKIVSNRCELDGWIIDSIRLDLVMQVSTKIRELCETSSLSMSWGIRENLKVARALRYFDPITAYRMAAGDYLEPQQRESLLDQVRSLATGRLPAVKLIPNMIITPSTVPSATTEEA